MNKEITYPFTRRPYRPLNGINGHITKEIYDNTYSLLIEIDLDILSTVLDRPNMNLKTLHKIVLSSIARCKTWEISENYK